MRFGCALTGLAGEFNEGMSKRGRLRKEVSDTQEVRVEFKRQCRLKAHMEKHFEEKKGEDKSWL